MKKILLIVIALCSVKAFTQVWIQKNDFNGGARFGRL